jgi:hypothetical protein
MHQPTDLRTLRTLRIEATKAVVALVEQLDLPAPLQIIMFDHLGLQIRLDDNDRGGVGAWAAALGYEVNDTRVNNRFTSVSAEGAGRDALAAWREVRVWSACDFKAADR